MASILNLTTPYATNLFGTHGQYAQGLFGVLILIVVLVARGGIVGTVATLWRRRAS